MGEDDVPKVDLDTCFGCAVCATGCSEEAIKMVSKPEFEEPPKDRKAMQETLFASFAKQG
jgi:ferredoxin